MTGPLPSARAKQTSPATDSRILPTENFHITPHTDAGLHGREDAVDRSRVPVGDVDSDDVRRINNYRAEYRIPVAPTEELEEVTKFELGPPGRCSPSWPREMLTNQLKDKREVFAVRNVDNQMNAIQSDGRRHIVTTTT